ncbi:hypothetical protein ZIOFF_025706 [Zingiber officinale]|uniref:Uncharacterized protein n=1 Tax=Zingiber officinale TaxID=94328 RepID=A0A8J5LET9_ZINOF|nr:hypothetical protein ZIOFF_025706 [Zingiber officinale]
MFGVTPSTMSYERMYDDFIFLLSPVFDRIIRSTNAKTEFVIVAEAQAAAVGVNYGLLGDNLPSTEQVVALCASRGIGRLRLFHPDEAVLGALRGSGIEVVLGTFNEELPGLASDPSAAENWVAANVVPFAGSVRFRYINAGNEVIPGDNAGYVLPAIRNLDAALRAAGLQIPVTTAVATMVLGVSYPPSQGAFSEAAAGVMAPIAAFLRSTSAPLLVNAYPYFSYARNEVALDYALFKAAGAPVIDGTLVYDNLFDAMVDAVYAALEKKEGVRDLLIVYEGESIGCLAMEDARGGWLADKQGLREIHNLNKFHVRRDPYSFAGMGLWTLLEGFLLLVNALAILNEDRFLAPRGWSFNEVTGGARVKSLRGQLIGLIYATQYLRVPLIVLNTITILVKLVSG